MLSSVLGCTFTLLSIINICSLATENRAHNILKSFHRSIATYLLLAPTSALLPAPSGTTFPSYAEETKHTTARLGTLHDSKNIFIGRKEEKGQVSSVENGTKQRGIVG